MADILKVKCPKCGHEFTVNPSKGELISVEAYKNDIEQRIKKEKELSELKVESKYKDEINELKSQIKFLNAQKDSEIKLAKEQEKNNQNKQISDLNQKISQLQSDIKNKDFEIQLKLKLKDEEIEHYKNFKTRSTKGIGEELEQYCKNEFDGIRSTAFPEAEFYKDNQVVENTKGDFVFREKRNGVEFISIMFEMKNESDLTKSKQKNADFYDKLDKDRKKKNCEYAVLVTTLEPESNLFNKGIVDISYEYEKMFVIRPEFFIAIISLLRNAALKNLDLKYQLAERINSDRDFSNFEAKMKEFKDGFNRNYNLAAENYKSAIEKIDKSIKELEKVKEHLTKSNNQLRLANDKISDLSVKKLTKDSPITAKAILDSRKK